MVHQNFKFLKEKPIEKMKDSPQFLHILQAEHDHLITVQIKLHDQAQQVLERDLSNAFTSDGTGPVSKAWNAQRKLVVAEALEKHLLPLGTKWAREWLREEIEDGLAKKCGDSLQDVSQVSLLYPYFVVLTPSRGLAHQPSTVQDGRHRTRLCSLGYGRFVGQG